MAAWPSNAITDDPSQTESIDFRHKRESNPGNLIAKPPRPPGSSPARNQFHLCGILVFFDGKGQEVSRHHLSLSLSLWQLTIPGGGEKITCHDCHSPPPRPNSGNSTQGGGGVTTVCNWGSDSAWTYDTYCGPSQTPPPLVAPPTQGRTFGFKHRGLVWFGFVL